MTIILDGTTGITTPAINSSGDLELPGGTANGVLYLNGSKVATSGSAITYDGTTFKADAAAVFNDSGADVDFRVESDTNTHALFVDGHTGYVGLGNNAPSTQLQIEGSTFSLIRLSAGSGDNNAGIDFGTVAAPDTARFRYNNSSNAFTWRTNGTDAMVLDSAQNLGLGVTPGTWTLSGASAMQIKNAGWMGYLNNSYFTANASNAAGAWKYIANGTAALYEQVNGTHAWSTAASGTAGNTISFTQAMTLDASGRLGIGTTSPDTTLDISNSGFKQLVIRNSVGPDRIYMGTVASTVGSYIQSNAFYDNSFEYNPNDTASEGIHFQDGAIWFSTNSGLTSGVNFVPTERARITSGGDFLVGKTTTALTTAGVAIESTGTTGIATGSAIPLYINRQTDDGTLIEFRQAGSTEGSISVSGNTVSYNAFAGSHWSQLQDGSKPDILRGTVMESINELCVWPDETNERLPKCKISDTAGSKKVYGVFMAWDNDWTETNDMYVTAVGAFVCRVNSGVTVQEGDLLESNGDGTARVQADDLIRSSTIGKVTSTVKTHEYDDGSYCVPTVLYCG